MFKFFRQSLSSVDYGEREFCGEQTLLYVAEYQQYLSSAAPLGPDRNQEKATASTSSARFHNPMAQCF